MFTSLQQVIRDPDRSALRMLLAIFFWFLGYNAIEAFFTLYAQKHLGLAEADGARLLGQLSFIFVIMALPAGYLGGRFGRRRTILAGIALITLVIMTIFGLPISTLVTPLTRLPVLGLVPVIGLLLMVAGPRLGSDQHQFAAHGRRYDRRRTPGHIHRAVLPVFNVSSHRRSKPQRLDHPTFWLELQHHHDDRPSFYVPGLPDDARRPAGRSCFVCRTHPQPVIHVHCVR